MLRYDDVLPLGRICRVIVRNSAACKHCGVEINCTDKDPEDWVTHECTEGWFAIRGGLVSTESNGSNADHTRTWVFRFLVGVQARHNPDRKGYWAPDGETMKCA